MSKGYKENYRKIWINYYGSIPIDENGRSYDIHHIDGNKNNNDITNLLAVSIKDHFEIHYKQGDYEACKAISLRINNLNFKDYKLSNETKNKIRAKHLSKKENHWAKRPEVRLKISKSTTGEKNNNFGKYGELHHNYGKKWKLTDEQIKNRCGSNNANSKKIYQYDQNLKFIRFWSTIKEAAEYYNIHSSAIVKSIKKGHKSKGYIWKYS